MGPPRYGHPEVGDIGHRRASEARPTAAEYLMGIRKAASTAFSAMCAVEFYGQAERAISNGKLNVLPRLHIRPIKLVVFQCPS